MGGTPGQSWASGLGSSGSGFMKSGEDGAGDSGGGDSAPPTQVTTDGHGGYNPSFWGEAYTSPTFGMQSAWAPYAGLDAQAADAFKPQQYTDGRGYGRWASIGIPPGGWKPLFPGDTFGPGGQPGAPVGPTPPPTYGRGAPPETPMPRVPGTTPIPQRGGPSPYRPRQSGPGRGVPPIYAVGPSGPYAGAPGTGTPPGGGGGATPPPSRGTPGLGRQKLGYANASAMAGANPQLQAIYQALASGNSGSISPTELNPYGSQGGNKWNPAAVSQAYALSAQGAPAQFAQASYQKQGLWDPTTGWRQKGLDLMKTNSGVA